MKESNTSKYVKIFLYGILALFLAGSIVNCGGSSSGPAQVQAPTALIQDYIAMHETMVDPSLADLYVNAEKPAVSALVQKTINERKAAGDLEKLQNATFDFSNIKISVLGEKEDYVDDQPTRLIKVSVSGTYTIKEADQEKTVQADETIIFGLVDNNWKVTERINPWS